MHSGDPWRVMRSSPPDIQAALPVARRHAWDNVAVAGVPASDDPLTDPNWPRLRAVIKSTIDMTLNNEAVAEQIGLGVLHSLVQMGIIDEAYANKTTQERPAWRAMTAAIRSALLSEVFSHDDIIDNGMRAVHNLMSRPAQAAPMVQGEVSGKFQRRAPVPQKRGTYRYRSGILRELAPILAPATGGIGFVLDLDEKTGVLKATVSVDERIYDASVDLSPVIAAAMEKARQWHEHFKAEDKARGVPLVGALPYTMVGADCGTRVYQGVTQRVYTEILRAVAAAFPAAPLSGSGAAADPLVITVSKLGYHATLRGVWNPDAATLQLNVDSDAPCDMVWNMVDPTLKQAITQAAGTAMLLHDIDNAAQVAGDILVDSIIDHHKRTICAGWFGDLERDVKKAVNSVEKDVKGVVHTVEHTVSALAPLLEKAAPLVATALGGPAAGAIAGQIVSAATSPGGVGQLAQQAVSAAQQAAGSNPQIAAALQAAQQAVATTTAATHVAKTAAQAASGNQAAQQQIAQMAQSAAQGDPAAQQAMNLAQQAGTTLSAGPSQIAQAAQNMAAAAASCLPSCLPSCAPSCAPQTAGWLSDLERGVEDAATGGLAEGVRALEHHRHKRPKEHEHAAAAAHLAGWFSDLERGVEDAATGGLAEGVRALEHHRHKRPEHHGKEHEYAVKAAEHLAGWFSSLEHAVERGAEDFATGGLAEGVRALEHHGKKHPEHHGKEHEYAVKAEKVAGDAASELRSLAQKVAHNFYFDRGVLYVGFCATPSGQESMFFGSRDQADAWYAKRAVDPNLIYAAIFDASSPSWPGPASEQFSKMIAPPTTTVGNGGPTHWTLDWSRPKQIVGHEDGAGASVGAAADALEGIRRHASDVAVEVHTNTGKNIVAIVIRPDGSAATGTYASSDAADDAFGAVTRLPFVYAAYYDANDPTWPAPLNEAVGAASVTSAPGAAIHRDVATTGA
jgi:hypothetical protein